MHLSLIILGNRSTLHITLENVSSLPIDFLRLTFEDSTIEAAQQALAEGELSVFDTYETEYDLIHRPLLSWNGLKGFEKIDPSQKTTLAIVCHGKVGWWVSGFLSVRLRLTFTQHEWYCSHIIFVYPSHTGFVTNGSGRLLCASDIVPCYCHRLSYARVSYNGHSAVHN